MRVNNSPMKKIAVSQSNYIPWKGYFDLIAAVDEFIIYDDTQYTRRDWRNRNIIKTPQGLQWLTVPVVGKGRYFQKIYETEIAGSTWAKNHWRALAQNYSRSPYFEEIASWLEPLYLRETYTQLSPLNLRFIKSVCEYLAIDTLITSSSCYKPRGDKSERLVHLCLQAGGSKYISGPTAKRYIDEEVFSNADIALTWFNYGGYPKYPQLWGKFKHEVSILDLLFNCGKESGQFMKWVS